MPTYRLIFHEDALGVGKTVEFNGQTAGSAFSVLERERDARTAELWTGQDKLADIVRDRSGVWLVKAKWASIATQEVTD